MEFFQQSKLGGRCFYGGCDSGLPWNMEMLSAAGNVWIGGAGDWCGLILGLADFDAGCHAERDVPRILSAAFDARRLLPEWHPGGGSCHLWTFTPRQPDIFQSSGTGIVRAAGIAAAGRWNGGAAGISASALAGTCRGIAAVAGCLAADGPGGRFLSKRKKNYEYLDKFGKKGIIIAD